MYDIITDDMKPSRAKNMKKGKKTPKNRNSHFLDARFHTGAGSHGDKKKYSRKGKYKKDWKREY